MNILNSIFGHKLSAYYPSIPNEIDLRLRIPRKRLNKMTVLNVGVGNGHSGLARQLPYLNFKRLDLLDVHEPYLEAAKARVWNAEKVNFIPSDIRDFNTDIYDIVLMFDVLEHLPKEDSLAIMDRIKGKQVVFGPLEKHFRKNTFDAKSQDHLSLWTEKDFKERGYETEILKNFHREGNDIFDALWAIKK